MVVVVLAVLMRLLVHLVPEEEVPVVLDQVKHLEMGELLILVVVLVLCIVQEKLVELEVPV